MTAQAPEFITRPVPETAPCFVVSPKSARRRSQGALPANQLLLSHIGAVPKGSGRKSATAGRTFRITTLVPVDRPLTLRNFARHVSAEAGVALLDAAENRGGFLTFETVEEIINALRNLRPEMTESLDALARLNNGQSVVSDGPVERYAEDRDKLGVAMRIFDAPVSQPWRRPLNDDDPYTMGLAKVRSGPVEADAIAHDAGIIQSFKRVFTDRRHVRYDLKVFHSQDLDTYTGRPRVMQTLNINATGAEAVTGGDLLYYHIQSKSCVVVQYKRLEGRGARYRVDNRLRDQLGRMARVNGANRQSVYLDDWRLGPDSCYLKLIEPQGEVDPDDTGMVDGRYLPLSYVETLLRHTGREEIISMNSIRHLTNTLFITLVREGWIGTVGVDIDQIMEYCRDRVEGRESQLIAFDHSHQTQRERIIQSRRRGK